MKKFVSVFALAAFMACGAAKAQFVGTGAENNGNANEVDSLRTVVGTLSKQVDNANQAELDQKIWKDRAKYFNIGFVKQSLTSKDDYIKYKSEAGVNITWGKKRITCTRSRFGGWLKSVWTGAGWISTM